MGLICIKPQSICFSTSSPEAAIDFLSRSIKLLGVGTAMGVRESFLKKAVTKSEGRITVAGNV